MALQLLDLPDELIAQILSYLVHENSKRTLRNAAVSCKQLCELTRPPIFANAEVRINYPFKDDSLFGWSKTSNNTLFEWSIDKNPQLKALVRDLHLRWASRKKGDTRRIHRIMNDMSAIHSLTLQFFPPFTPIFLENSSFDRLRSITFTYITLTYTDFSKFMLLPKLRSMSFYRGQFLDEEFPSNDSVYGKSTVKYLQLGKQFHLSQHQLSRILKGTAGLKQLLCRLPGVEVWNRSLDYKQSDENAMIRTRGLTTLLSPSATVRALSPHKSFLEALTLMDLMSLWKGHDMSLLDLSSFVSLKKLIVPISCFYQLGASGKKSRGLSRLPPNSLKHLELYTQVAKVSPENQDYWSIPVEIEDLPTSIIPSYPGQIFQISPLKYEDCLWLEELAQCKQLGKHLQHLTRVTLKQYWLGKSEWGDDEWSYYSYGGKGFSCDSWVLPLRVSHAFAAAGIKLDCKTTFEQQKDTTRP